MRVEIPYCSDFVTLESCNPDAYKSPNMQNNSLHASHRMQRSMDCSEDVLIMEYPVGVISVAVV